MAAFTSKATGNWGASGQTTWNEVGVPGNGDTVTINGPHVVTVDDARTIGTSGAEGTTVITMSGTAYAHLRIAAGGALTCRGDVFLGSGSALEIQPGGTLTWDSTASSSPTTIGYALKDTGGGYTHVLHMHGSDDATRAVMTSDVSGGAKKGRIALNQTATYCVLEWARFSNLTGMELVACSDIIVSDTVIDSTVGAVTLGVAGASGDWTLERVQSLTTSTFMLDNATTPTTGARTITACSFTGLLSFRSHGWALSNVVGNNDIVAGNSYAGLASWANVFLRKTAGAGSASVLPSCALYADTLFFYDNPSNSNAHGYGVSSDNKPATVEFDGWVIEADVDGGNGDVLFPNASGSTEVRRCLTLPNFDGNQPGCFLNVGTVSGAIVVEHNTFISPGGQCGVAVAEVGDTATDAITSLRSNLAYRLSAGNGALLARMDGFSGRLDIASPATTGYNALAGITGHALGGDPTYLGYDSHQALALFSTAPSGATTDVSVSSDPFVDSARGIRTYAVMRGLASSGDSNATKKTALFNALLAIPNPADANYDAAVTIADALSWIRAGFAPTDAGLQAAHDAEVGGWIGAVEGSASAGAVAPLVGGGLATSPRLFGALAR